MATITTFGMLKLTVKGEGYPVNVASLDFGFDRFIPHLTEQMLQL